MGNAKVFWGRLVRAASVVVLGAALAVPVAHAGKANTGKSGKPAATAAKKAPAKKTVAKAAPARKVGARKAAPVRSSKTAAARKKTAAKAAVAAAAVAPRLSFGQLAGLHQVHDPLALESSVALVMDQDTKEVLLSKNEQVVLPIASISKLMTGLVVANAQLPMDELITITQADVDTVKRSSSRLQVGTTLSRRELLHLALMSSENRAAHALGRTYPGGMDAFVEQMNFKAKLLGMTATRFVEPTGLSSSNQSSARDLATLVNVAHAEPLLRSFSTWPSAEVEVGKRTLQFNNTNRLVKSDDWEIGLQKTGYISEAGRCLVMQAEVAGRNLIMVFLDSVGKYSRLGDAQRVRQWIEAGADHS
ncbi:D-alanyl-D-alanine endopeptidase [Comamonas nitrativorans]|uniref:D-alanyl-D-alanine endopeptidase n=1 Tax=Comamonas nitrativorans TaxID=108437 RepID=A0ABV9H0P5_9BURK